MLLSENVRDVNLNSLNFSKNIYKQFSFKIQF